ncbi:MAG: carboxy-S-adenosyl-L-methionine synthase CmoA [Desulfobulbus propionicus]|nr:MAG: carboxy-S-adenosyl-L-methionine synthase CmoA [Desulfobulbus propionicus]
MKMDTIYSSGTVQTDFSFNQSVAEVFDDMVSRSVPFYHTVIQAVADLLSCRLEDGHRIYDLGCSTGTTLLTLSSFFKDKNLAYVGIDKAQPMIDKAISKSRHFSKSHIISFFVDDILTCPLDNPFVLLCNYTLQFLRPLSRQDLIKRLYDALPPGGMLVISEKTIAHSRRLNRDFIESYHKFKRQQGYSELEIAAKREALENVLVPFSMQENLQMLEQAGFSEREVFFKWNNFTSFIALK